MRLAALSALLLLAACSPAAPAPQAPAAPTAPFSPMASAVPPEKPPAELLGLPCAQKLLAEPDPPAPPRPSLGPRVALDLNAPSTHKGVKGKGLDLGTIKLQLWREGEILPNLGGDTGEPSLPFKALEEQLTGNARSALQAVRVSREDFDRTWKLKYRFDEAWPRCKEKGCDACMQRLEARLPEAPEASRQLYLRRLAELRAALTSGEESSEILLSYLAKSSPFSEVPAALLDYARSAVKRGSASTERGSFIRLWLASYETDKKVSMALEEEVIAQSPSVEYRIDARWSLAAQLPETDSARLLEAIVTDAAEPSFAYGRSKALWRLTFVEGWLGHSAQAFTALQRLLLQPNPETRPVLELTGSLVRALRSLPKDKQQIELPAVLARGLALALSDAASAMPRSAARAALQALPEAEKNADTRQAEASLEELDKDPKKLAHGTLMRLTMRCGILVNNLPSRQLQIELRPLGGQLKASLSPSMPAVQSCFESQSREYANDGPLPTAKLSLSW